MLDAFGRRHVYLRVAVTDRCNLRCGYCMPAKGVPWKRREEILTFDEIGRAVGIFAGLGICKVRLTGGEPTVRPGLVDLARRLARVPGVETLALTTNGVTLEEMAQPFWDAGVRNLNVSLDTLQRSRFEKITGRDRLPEVLRGIAAALAAGFAPLKLNTVVLGTVNDDELLNFVELARGQAINLRFIEYMPVKGNAWSQSRFVPFESMREAIGRVHSLVRVGHGEHTGGVAKDFSIEGFQGRISFITPLSDSFCARCNRLRLTPEGRLKTCLFAPSGLDLKAPMRAGASDEELAALIRAAVAAKPAAHLPMGEMGCGTDAAMNEIGG